MRAKVKDAKRVVIKLGSSLFFNESGNLALGRIYSFIEDIAEARLSGRQVIVVSSGGLGSFMASPGDRAGSARGGGIARDRSVDNRYVSAGHKAPLPVPRCSGVASFAFCSPGCC